MDREKHQHFAEQMVRDQHRLYGYILTLVPNRADAEELFQQSSISLWKNWERFNPELDFFPWACGFALNHVRNFARKKNRRPVCLAGDVIEAIAGPCRDMHDGETDRLVALRQCMARLPERSRRAVERYYRGQSVAEISRESGRSENAIYKLLRRSRQQLYDCITQRLATGTGS